MGESNENTNGLQRENEQPSRSNGLKVLICSGNLGNAQPDVMSAQSWIPLDGDVEHVMKNTRYPLGQQIDEALMTGHFDIIAIGMQEATFNTKRDDVKTGLKKHTKQLGAFVNVTVDLADKTLNKMSQVASEAAETIVNPVLSVAADGDYSNLKKSGSRYAISNPQSLFGGTENLHWLLMERNPSYECPVHFQRGQIRLMILVRKELIDEVSEIESKAENTGLGSVLANKGGIAVNVTIRNTRICFITAHLAAHEGPQHYKDRCEDLEEILSGARLGPHPRRYDVSVRSHHCFVFGDLNFRVQLPQNESASSLSASITDETKHKEQHDRALALIEEKNWVALNDADELAVGIKKGDCLADFKTLPCNFPPTFKVLRNEDLEYNTKRIPSYTDRILWKSNDTLESNLQPFLYEPCIGYTASDHKPIRGAFVIQPNMDTCDTLTSSTAPKRGLSNIPRKLHIFIEDISCTGLTTDSFISTCNPFISLVTTPEALCEKVKKKFLTKLKLFHSKDEARSHKGFPRTTIMKNKSDPEWKNLDLHLVTTAWNRKTLNGGLLHITAFHYGGVSEENVIGSVTINLQTPFFLEEGDSTMKTEEINRPLMKNGLETGRLKCTLIAWWLQEEQSKGAWLSMKSFKKGNKKTLKKLRHGRRGGMNRKSQY
mmetsp:Transcript_23895/g.29077  ORF Transcript_23895/g.29077 Transcript_23895/m.29077 type:complete len:659 (+) Transcript_23895:37-2013(+)|eukprot:CAMPEP_0172506404 /NCGR_PEP_ID=MMETSP1066-20121228/194816_1 /TAXON_ID=671091 /ORGANISM="Coscinodiscus wailesii, Strain CCMP2513" /LENGTH=658 /DNA_ID=CAMNT_0013283425 /DNA_START=32 /DNA_END=2008 /DNA_ORIENTATION=+